jgi:hypothetical protein
MAAMTPGDSAVAKALLCESEELEADNDVVGAACAGVVVGTAAEVVGATNAVVVDATCAAAVVGTTNAVVVGAACAGVVVGTAAEVVGATKVVVVGNTVVPDALLYKSTASEIPETAVSLMRRQAAAAQTQATTSHTPRPHVNIK